MRDLPQGTTEISQPDFDAILDAIVERNLTVLTTRDAIRSYARTRRRQ